MAIKTTIAAGLQDKIDAKAAIKAAIIAKGVPVTTELLSDYAGKVEAIDAHSWANYIAVRNRTKTTIEAGEIDVSTLTGTYSAYALFSYTALTSAVLNLSLIDGPNSLGNLFANSTLLTTISLNIKSLSVASGMSGVFTNVPVNNLIITGMGNFTIYSSTAASTNLFAQTQLATCQNLSITVPILPNLYLAVMTSLNLASVVQVLGQLYDYSAGAAHTITFNKAFTGLSAGDYALINNAKNVANNRNWTVAGLTYSM